MARPIKTGDEKRTVILRVRLTAGEKKQIGEAAQTVSLSMSDFLRTRTLDSLPRLKKLSPEREAVHAGLATLGKMGNELRQSMRKSGDAPALVEDMSGAIKGIEMLTSHLIKLLEHGH